MVDVFERIGKKILELLGETEMTQTDLAREIGMSKQVVSKIVRGKKAINVEEISKIASVLNITIDELISPVQAEMQTNTNPMLTLMGTVTKANTKDDLRFLNHVMDEMVALKEMAQR